MLENLFPILLSLTAAFLFALGAMFQSMGLQHIDSKSGAAITISTSAILFLLAAPFFLKPTESIATRACYVPSAVKLVVLNDESFNSLFVL